MIETLLITLIVLAVANIVIGLKKKVTLDIKPQLKDVEESILKFDTTLERTEKSIKDEFQRNRSETNDISKTNRDELTKSLSLFGEQFSKNVKELNDLLNEKFAVQNKQQIEFNKQTSDSTKENRDELSKSLKSFEENFSENIKNLNDLLRQNFGDFNKQQIDLNKRATENIKDVEKTIEKNLKSIREDNTTQLNEMRKTVDEKLQTTLEKRLGESFKQVSDRLEQVHKGLGEMQNIATGVGDLKKVLSNVKTRGVLGEYQLENILEQILTPDQYAKNVATKKGSQANVEFALKLPGKESGKEVWLPIDSKFPIEDYDRLLNAFDKGEKEDIESAQKILIKKIESFAKDISDKYIDPPHTTDFGIMFLPVESLYAEVLRHPGLFEILQRKYKITVTGPTTLSALLNSLQMGFRTLAVQKRSSEVWDILKAVKFEFKEFSGVLTKVHKQINTASGTLDTLRTTRTNVMERKLKDVETFTALESKEILELPDNNLIEESNEV
ncbi:DNA recombination protein RmuC [Ancylomarina longa]|uniref:DNA recombination protein RmuC n=1 Tax=Ancylomarina longa TaxID=2487017 RepID=A0A434AG00_9BACT|nr:DNA recombination protein RmuC [Ancylomarina longa]RUT73294.1 DNA recombination protein RmuC [Ancylomarina longa]